MRATPRALTLLALGALVALPTSLPAIAQAGSASDISHRQSVRTEMAADGEVREARVFTQLTVQGDGPVEVALPDQSTQGLRNLEGFGRPQVEGDQVIFSVDATPDGTAERTVAEHTGDTPITLEVSYTLDGEPIEPGDLVGRSGEVEVSFTVRNTTAQPTDIRYFDGRGNPNDETIDVAVPFVGSISLDLDARFVDIDAPLASVAGNGRGDTRISWSLVLFEPVGSEEHTVTYRAYVSDAIVPEVVAQFLPVDADSFGSLRSVQETFGGVADGLRSLTTGGLIVDGNVQLLAAGASQLLDGLGQLSDGATQLAEGLNESAVPGSRQLADGTGAARAGSRELATGLLDLEDGAGRLSGGLGQARAGSGDLASGLNQLADGAGALSGGLGQARTGSSQLASGLRELEIGAGTLSGGLGAARAGSGALVDGLGQLATGAGDLSGGLGSARVGSDALAAGLSGSAAPGAQELAEGLSEAAAPGAAQIRDGLRRLLAGFGASDDDATEGTLLGGVSALLAGLTNDLAAGTGAMRQLSAGLAISFGPDADGNDAGERASAAAAGAQQLADGGATVEAGAGALIDGVEGAQGSLEQIQGGFQQLSPAVSAGLAAIGEADLVATYDALVGNIGAVADGLDGVTGGLAGLQEGGAGIAAGGGALADGLSAQASQLGSWPANCEAAVGAVMSNAEPSGLQVIRALSCIAVSVDDGLTDTVIPGVRRLRGGLDNPACDLADPTDPDNPCGVKQVLQALEAGATELTAGIDAAALGAGDLATGLAGAAQGSVELSGGLALLEAGGLQLRGGASQAAAGATDLRSGLVQLDEGGQALRAGTGAAASGAGDLRSGLVQLDEGGRALEAGAGTAASGAGDLRSGLVQLDDGGQELAAGAGRAATGANDLANGLVQIDDGANQLADGLGDAGDGSQQLAEGLESAEDGGQQIADGTQAVSDQGMASIIEGASDATATPAIAVEHAKAADARGRAGDGLPYGTVDGATASAVYQFELAGIGGPDEGPSTPVRAAAALAAFGLAGALGFGLRRLLA